MNTVISVAESSIQPSAKHNPQNFSHEQYHFTDNFEHLQALEEEAKLLLTLFYWRICNTTKPPTTDVSDDYRDYLEHWTDIKTLEDHLRNYRQQCEMREEKSLNQGIELQLPKLCACYHLDAFERQVLVLMFVCLTSTDFQRMLSDSQIQRDHVDEYQLSAGNILDILCHDYRSRLLKRQYFNIHATLMKEELIRFESRYEEDVITTSALTFQQRIFQFILGDNNVYGIEQSIISTIQPSITLSQVILPEDMKQEIVQCVENYAQATEKRNQLNLQSFYGYGTGLTLLFQGASGTGKTMLAHGLAKHLNKPLFVLQMGRLRETSTDFDTAIKMLLTETRLGNGIAFLDECDDILVDDSYENRAFLIEIEKSDCILIMATNKAENLDPALNRRIALKTEFQLPDKKSREKLWKALVPPTIIISDNIDFKSLAQRYCFTGGMIKNAILIAINKVISHAENTSITLTNRSLQHAANQQAKNRIEQSQYKPYYPQTTLSDLSIQTSDQQRLLNIAKIYPQLRQQLLGLSCLLTCVDVTSGIDCVHALANNINLPVRKFDIETLTASNNEKILNPLNQHKVSLLEYAFADYTGYEHIMLIVDRQGYTVKNLEKSKESNYDLQDKLWKKLEQHQGFLFLVSQPFASSQIPISFSTHIEIGYPDETKQVDCWLKNLNSSNKTMLINLVKKYPLFLSQIDTVINRAKIESLIEGNEGVINFDQILQIIQRVSHQPIRQNATLFGYKKNITSIK